MRLLIVITQVSCYFGLWFLAFFLRARYVYKPGVEFKPGAIFIANHQSRLDPVIIHLGIPLRQYLKMVPIYAPTAKKYMGTWWSAVPLLLVGSIPVDTSSKQKSAIGLYKFLEKIERGETVMIFPEGRVTVSPNAGKIFSGAGYIVTRWKLPVIPVHVSGFSGITPKSLLSRSHRATIVYGRSIRVMQKSAGRSVDTIMNIIYAL